MTSGTSTIWTSQFWRKKWTCKNFLVLPNESEEATPSSSIVTAKKWAKGQLYLEDSVDIGKSCRYPVFAENYYVCASSRV
jgi:hypothetical protein